jgi:ribonucleoside-diphosphate reductase alpha chain
MCSRRNISARPASPRVLKKPSKNPTSRSFLWRSRPRYRVLAALPEEGALHARRPVGKEVFDRLAGTWTYWGWKGGYFDSEEDARAFFDELRFMLATQMVAPNSPQWFNTGLHWAYGIDGPGQGHYYVDFKTGQARQVEVGL